MSDSEIPELDTSKLKYYKFFIFIRFALILLIIFSPTSIPLRIMDNRAILAGCADKISYRCSSSLAYCCKLLISNSI